MPGDPEKPFAMPDWETLGFPAANVDGRIEIERSPRTRAGGLPAHPPYPRSVSARYGQIHCWFTLLELQL
jgi:hypothetical protein